MCNEDEDAVYKVVFKHNLNPICHSEYFSNEVIETPYFSGLTLFSHNERRIYDRCTKHPNVGGNEDIASKKALFEIRQKEGLVLSYFISKNLLKRTGRSVRSGYIRVNSANPYVTFESILVRLIINIIIVHKFEYTLLFKQITDPYQGLHVGVNGLNLCDKYGWKDNVAVCTELFILENGSAITEVVQGNQCSFGTFIFTRVMVPREIFPVSPLPSAGKLNL